MQQPLTTCQVSAGLKKIVGDEVTDATTADLFKGKRVVVFGLPGAFTPVCSASHLPGFVAKADEVKAKGIDDILCLTVNDFFVTKAWGKDQGVCNLFQ